MSSANLIMTKFERRILNIYFVILDFWFQPLKTQRKNHLKIHSNKHSNFIMTIAADDIFNKKSDLIKIYKWSKLKWTLNWLMSHLQYSQSESYEQSHIFNKRGVSLIVFGFLSLGLSVSFCIFLPFSFIPISSAIKEMRVFRESNS